MKGLSADFPDNYVEPMALKKKEQGGGDFGRNLFPILIFALLLIGIQGFLYSQSYKSVDHGLHAVEVSPGKFIHGSLLNCTELGTGTRCNIELDGKLLTIRTHYATLVPQNPIRSCDAQYDNRHIRCTPDYPTSSYWAHGVSVRGAELDAAISQEAPPFSWQAFMLGAHEGYAMLVVFILFAAIPLLAVVIIPTAFRTRLRLPQSRADLQFNKTSFVMLITMWPATFVFMVYIMLRFGYID